MPEADHLEQREKTVDHFKHHVRPAFRCINPTTRGRAPSRRIISYRAMSCFSRATRVLYAILDKDAVEIPSSF